LKVFSVIDHSRVKKEDSPNSARAKRRAARKARKQKKIIPPRENLSAAEIRGKVAAHNSKLADKASLNREKMKKFESKKLPDMQDVNKGEGKKVIGDVGKNDPSDLATHGKLKRVLSMGGFAFNEKERAALEKILVD